MIQNLTTVVALGSLLILLYGGLQLITWQAPQECRMTYMYQYPQYTRIPVPEDVQYPKYQLYAYSEGSAAPLPVTASSGPAFTGAPVLFVHGNAGSHRQMRSFASVALRKAIDLQHTRQRPHLDYFAVDYSEELSAFFGGYLQPQADYLAHAIDALRQLYGAEHLQRTGLVIVAHSMGGKVAQAALQLQNVSDVVHTVLMLATPVDRPVLDVDFFTAAFYRQIDAYWTAHRAVQWQATNETDTCAVGDEPPSGGGMRLRDAVPSERRLLDKVLLITIGGGSRDRLVPAALTASRFSDVHAMSSAIPDVWLSTDHLCSVWCLQQVLVINRFLFEISAPGFEPIAEAAQLGPMPKARRLHAARRHLEQHANTVQERNDRRLGAEKLVTVALFGGREFGEAGDEAEWLEDSRRQFTDSFPIGFGKRRTVMLRLVADAQYRYAVVQLVNASVDVERGWLFGCAALETTGVARYCSRAERLGREAQERRLPSADGKTGRRVVELDLHAIRRAHPSWTHVLVRTEPTLAAFQVTVDIHAGPRVVPVQMPKWYSFSWSPVLHETDGRASSLRLHIAGLQETYQSLEIEVASRATCEVAQHDIVARVSVPWTRVGFERFHQFGAANRADGIFHLDVPVDRPHGYNTTAHPVRVQLYINAPVGCPVTIRVRNSFAQTAANVLRLFGHWLPAHLCIVLLLALKQQITVTPKAQPFKCARFGWSLLRSSSFFIITASRVFVKIIEWTKAMPPLDEYEHSMVISVLVHGAAVAVLTLLGGGAMAGVVGAGGAIWRRVDTKRWFCGESGAGAGGWWTVWTALRRVPMAMGTVLLGLVLSTCGGLALVLSCVFYLLIIIDMQKDYLLELNEAAATTETPTTSTADEAIESTESTPLIEATEPAATATDDRPKKVEDSDGDDDAAPASKTSAANDDNAAVAATAAAADVDDDDDDESISDAELNRLIRETLEQRKNNASSATAATTDEQQRRAVYEAMDVRQNMVNFHSTLFLCLLVLTLLNAPSILAWSGDIPFSYSLATDPSFIPAVVTILALTVMWQLNAPRQISGYSSIGTLLYLMAALCMLYAQDSFYRLNAFIAATFVCLAAHQWLTPLMSVQSGDNADADAAAAGGAPKKRMTPAEIDAMLEKIMEAERIDREQVKAAALAAGETVPDDDEALPVDEHIVSKG